MTSGSGNLPLFDFFLDLPHPYTSDKSSTYRLIPAPDEYTESIEISKELSESKSLGHITRCSFPDFSDKVQESLQVPPPATSSAGLNKYDVYLTGFQSHYHKFTIKSSLGMLIGHTRTYLPNRIKSRADVGRRCHRSLIIFTRRTNLEKFFNSALKTIEAIIMVETSCPIPPSPTSSIQTFLHSLLMKDSSFRNPNTETNNISVGGIEFGKAPKHLPFDQTHFVGMPVYDTPVLPLLRALGPQKTVRLLSALMCERRIVFLSSSPTRLSQCVSSATAMLSHGMLTWPHIVIPVLPPHQFPALANNTKPYIVGVVTKCARELHIDKMAGVEDVVMFSLDHEGGFVRLLGAGVGRNLDLVAPDLLRSNMTDDKRNFFALGDALAQDLIEMHKNDKFRYTSNIATTVSNIAKKGGAAAKRVASVIGRFANNRILNNATEAEEPPVPTEPEEHQLDASVASNINDDTYIMMENALGEDEVKSAFVCFFLNLFGSGPWYMSLTSTGIVPDKSKFLEERRRKGDTQGTAMYPLLYFFIPTKMFDNFIVARIAEKQAKTPIVQSSSLFLQCADYLARNQVSFTPFDVRRVVKQMTVNSPVRQQIVKNELIRNVVLSMTSSRPYEGNLPQDISKVTGVSRVTTTKLIEIMDIIWLRLRNSKNQWKPALQALFLLKNLILHGPITAVSEALYGLDKIRSLKTYQSSNRSNSVQVQNAAKVLNKLLVDRANLFSLRRAYATRRRMVTDERAKVNLRKQANIKPAHKFPQIHEFFRPNANSTAATNDLLNLMDNTTSSVNTTYTNDLLSLRILPVDNPAQVSSIPTEKDPSHQMNTEPLSQRHLTNQLVATSGQVQSSQSLEQIDPIAFDSSSHSQTSSNTTGTNTITNHFSFTEQKPQVNHFTVTPTAPVIAPVVPTDPVSPSVSTSTFTNSSQTSLPSFMNLDPMSNVFDMGILKKENASVAKSSQAFANPFAIADKTYLGTQKQTVTMPQVQVNPSTPTSGVFNVRSQTNHSTVPQQQTYAPQGIVNASQPPTPYQQTYNANVHHTQNVVPGNPNQQVYLAHQSSVYQQQYPQVGGMHTQHQTTQRSTQYASQQQLDRSKFQHLPP